MCSPNFEKLAQNSGNHLRKGEFSCNWWSLFQTGTDRSRQENFRCWSILNLTRIWQYLKGSCPLSNFIQPTFLVIRYFILLRFIFRFSFWNRKFFLSSIFSSIMKLVGLACLFCAYSVYIRYSALFRRNLAHNLRLVLPGYGHWPLRKRQIVKKNNIWGEYHLLVFLLSRPKFGINLSNFVIQMIYSHNNNDILMWI